MLWNKKNLCFSTRVYALHIKLTPTNRVDKNQRQTSHWLAAWTYKGLESEIKHHEDNKLCGAVSQPQSMGSGETWASSWILGARQGAGEAMGWKGAVEKYKVSRFGNNVPSPDFLILFSNFRSYLIRSPWGRRFKSSQQVRYVFSGRKLLTQSPFWSLVSNKLLLWMFH